MKVSGFWEEIEQELEALERGLRESGLKGKLLRHSEHSQFMGSVAKLAEEAGLKHCPHVMVMDEMSHEPLWARKLPNAFAIPERTVIISKGMMDMTGSSTSMRMSPGLETVMAHEMSHLKHSIVGFHIAPFTLPLIAMAGLDLYDRARARTERKLEQDRQELYRQLVGNINGVADADLEKFRKAEKTPSDKWGPDPVWQQYVTHLARYALVGMAGMAMGLSFAQHASLHAEFRADKFAVQLTGKPEMLKKALVDIDKALMKARKNKPVTNDPVLVRFMDGWKDFIESHIHAHPSTEERISYIDQVMREKQNAAFVPRPTI
jgi:Zn-dependent protease with chaperone function